MEPKIKQVDNMAANRFHNGFYGQDILSVSQFDRTKLDYIFGVGNEHENAGRALWQRRPAARQNSGQSLL
jgi:hypothetical protein